MYVCVYIYIYIYIYIYVYIYTEWPKNLYTLYSFFMSNVYTFLGHSVCMCMYVCVFIIVLGRHLSILTESSSGPSKKTDPYLAMFNGIPQRIFKHFK